MSQVHASRRAALNIEEAALLPALPRKRGAGGAALQAALLAAEAMEEKHLSNAVSGRIAPAGAGGPAPGPADRGNVARAALNHVLRKGMR